MHRTSCSRDPGKSPIILPESDGRPPIATPDPVVARAHAPPSGACVASSRGWPTKSVRTPYRASSAASNGSTVRTRSQSRRSFLARPLAPGPYLRRDVVEDPTSLPPRASGKPQIQSRVVDRKKQPDILRHEEAPDPALQPKETRQTPQHLRPAHDRQLVQPGDPRHARRVHLAAADAEQPRLGQLPADLPRDRRAVVVSRGFAGGDEDRRSWTWGQDRRPR